ncbi:MAG TPA: HIT family protein [Victivallales bacterium]|nr:HIT family protein [Victivallales bacterium]
MTDNCVFCKIVNKQISDVNIVYEDELIIAFLSNAPINLGHTIIASKKHLNNISSINEEIAGRLFYLATRIGVAARRAIDADGYNIFSADGFCAGQDIQHTHINMVPRFIDDGFHWNWRVLETEKNINEITEKIKEKLKVDID